MTMKLIRTRIKKYDEADHVIAAHHEIAKRFN